jgi:hypothetical protein
LPRARIFISCGQRGNVNEPTSEAGIARKIESKLTELDFEPYLSIEQHSLTGFTDNILPRLEKSEYYLMIDFRREKINEGEFRGSLFSHQELAVATYLKKEHSLIFQEKGVSERDGIKGFIQCNPISFEDRNTLVGLVIEKILAEGWHTNWRNELEIIREDAESEFIPNTPFGPSTWYHIRVKNNHDKKIANNCVVYLLLIRDLDRHSERIPQLIEFKWKGVTTQSVSIPPGQFRYLDAFYVKQDSQNLIHLSFNNFLADTTTFSPSYTIIGPGTFQLKFVIYSAEFQAVNKRFNLRIGTSVDDLVFYGN